MKKIKWIIKMQISQIKCRISAKKINNKNKIKNNLMTMKLFNKKILRNSKY